MDFYSVTLAYDVLMSDLNSDLPFSKPNCQHVLESTSFSTILDLTG